MTFGKTSIRLQNKSVKKLSVDMLAVLRMAFFVHNFLKNLIKKH
ncbi:hypothetical protein EMA8858_02074 [Emticicia aquatica]|jgi:hypothetical protein|uniref:Transposase n=1 Tax=Emticicia aquatica TaxID=1681835 RepID=A0ABM9APV3_9BACT|nr:hypothetical protein EMA8858_02074 [Emticicia aquatica]